MANIYYNTLNKELNRAIYSKSISPEDLKKIYEKFKEKNNKKKKILNITMICVALMFILMEIPIFLKIDDIEYAKMILLFSIPIFVILYFAIYYTQVGLIKSQFDSAIKKNYPELANELHL